MLRRNRGADVLEESVRENFFKSFPLRRCSDKIDAKPGGGERGGGGDANEAPAVRRPRA